MKWFDLTLLSISPTISDNPQSPQFCFMSCDCHVHRWIQAAASNMHISKYIWLIWIKDAFRSLHSGTSNLQHLNSSDKFQPICRSWMHTHSVLLLVFIYFHPFFNSEHRHHSYHRPTRDGQHAESVTHLSLTDYPWDSLWIGDSSHWLAEYTLLFGVHHLRSVCWVRASDCDPVFGYRVVNSSPPRKLVGRSRF